MNIVARSREKSPVLQPG